MTLRWVLVRRMGCRVSVYLIRRDLMTGFNVGPKGLERDSKEPFLGLI